jgi:hypothetical protein
MIDGTVTAPWRSRVSMNRGTECPKTTLRRCDGFAKPQIRTTATRKTSSGLCTIRVSECPKTTLRQYGGTARLRTRTTATRNTTSGLSTRRGGARRTERYCPGAFLDAESCRQRRRRRKSVARRPLTCRPLRTRWRGRRIRTSRANERGTTWGYPPDLQIFRASSSGSAQEKKISYVNNRKASKCKNHQPLTSFSCLKISLRAHHGCWGIL